jgi:hypothetical protein
LVIFKSTGILSRAPRYPSGVGDEGIASERNGPGAGLGAPEPLVMRGRKSIARSERRLKYCFWKPVFQDENTRPCRDVETRKPSPKVFGFKAVKPI